MQYPGPIHQGSWRNQHGFQLDSPLKPIGQKAFRLAANLKKEQRNQQRSASKKKTSKRQKISQVEATRVLGTAAVRREKGLHEGAGCSIKLTTA